jgi:hypothetical protein
MTEGRMLDFLEALIGAEPELAPPSVAPVRFQVRTGSLVPPKAQMRATDYKVLIWKYKVKDLAAFAKFLDQWEVKFSDEFNKKARDLGLIDDKDPAKIIISQSYLGTFPARSPAGAAINRFNTAWGGRDDRLAIIEKCRVAIPGQLTAADEKWLAQELSKLFAHVSGEIDVELLDPSIGF